MEKEKDYKAGDICFYNRQTDELIVIPFHEWTVQQYPPSIFIPIGVVVIPSSHDVYGNGQCAIISLKEMNYDTPEEGGIDHQWMYWGQSTVDIPLKNWYLNVLTGTKPCPTIEASGVEVNSYMPSDNFSGTQCPTDPASFYHSPSKSYEEQNPSYSSVSPSPYLEDGSRNHVYYQTEDPSSEANCLADFDGKGNTKVLCDLATAQPNWKTDEKITDFYKKGYSPAACCCWRFHTEGTKQGDWYLPACGELGYMMARMKTINNTIEKLIETYGPNIGISVSTPAFYWSSSSHSNYYARNIQTCNGYIYADDRSYYDCVRAFLRI